MTSLILCADTSRLDDHLPLGIGLEEARAWLRSVRQWSLDPVAGLVYVGTPSRPLVIGQAPARGSDDTLALAGRSGARLRKLLCCPAEEDFRARFDSFNVLPKWPGKAGKGDRFPHRIAKSIASRIRFCSGPVLLLGGAAGAFGVSSWFEWEMLASGDTSDVWGCALPHPSGVNRWWNEADNKERAERFFKSNVPACFGQEPQ